MGKSLVDEGVRKFIVVAQRTPQRLRVLEFRGRVCEAIEVHVDEALSRTRERFGARAWILLEELEREIVFCFSLFKLAEFVSRSRNLGETQGFTRLIA